jgi:hypothetical protein
MMVIVRDPLKLNSFGYVSLSTTALDLLAQYQQRPGFQTKIPFKTPKLTAFLTPFQGNF